MMGIAQKIARDFADAVRSRGQSYFAKGRVVITNHRPGEVAARVKGTAPYRVRLKLKGNRLLASCTCPYFAPTGVPCKHLWATVLATDARNLLPTAPMRPLALAAVMPGPKKDRPAPDPSSAHPSPTPPPMNPSGDPLDFLGAYPDGLPSYQPSPEPPPYGSPPYPHYPATPGPNYGGGGGGQHQGRPPKGSKKNRYGKEKPRPPYLKGPGGGQGQAPSPYGAPMNPSPTQRPIGGKPGLPQNRNANKKSRNNKQGANGAAARTSKRPLYYIIDVPSTLNQNQLVVDLARRQQRPGQERGPLRPWYHAPGTVGGRPDIEDLEPLAALELAQTIPATPAAIPPATPAANGTYLDSAALGTRRYIVDPSRQVSVLEKVGKTGRARLRRAEGEDEPPSLRWDDGPPWQFWIDIRPADSSGKRWLWRGSLRRGEQRLDLGEPLVLLPGLVILTNGKAARFDDAGIYLWMARLRHEKEMALSDVQQDTMLGRILGESGVPPSQLVEGLKLEEVDLPPTPCLTVRTPRQNWGREADNLIAELEFDYEGARVPAFPAGRVAVQTDRRRAIRRSERVESEAKARLEELGFREIKDFRYEPGTMEVSPKKMPQATRELVQAGWRVEAEGTLIRPAGDFKMNVTSGMDWFELDGRVDFGGQNVALPEILAAAGRGETMIRLGDGSMGLLPDDWLQKYSALAELGIAEGESIRFGKDQAAVLDALVAAQADVRVDATFEEARKRLHRFEGIVAIDAPPGFRGELRPYQREGLGWLEYLTQFGLGGILADDMGLGKTIQVLALLQRRRFRRQMKGPSLIVVPRSLVFNWLQEAEKFTPRLRVLDYTGPGRHASREEFRHYDLIVTTYGVMRSDIAELAQFEFDYVILDEAQAIKNAESQSAKAARLLQGRHKLAMSGTPIENHLGELWSIVEFLNPGMLGSASIFKKVVGSGSSLDDEGKKLLSKALKPIILRRTKAQVVKDLPEKFEQTLYCDMEPAQRQLYEELRAHYRAALLRRESGGASTNKIEVLEALLRLRQAACHPGLIDEARRDDQAAKLDILLPSVEEVIDEGHKALIFSQFTSFLSIVRDKLDKAKIPYEYLDGQTRDRQARVERFQSDPDCRLFLISLKAGGLGLNLTAAEYVYLLDPWWNPAVEAQAIDRSHRIGQTQNVFAYRLICRDSVEQKILELQQRKRDLADAILGADNQSVIKALTRDDLEFLLS
ncbi:MAG: DEAD/DEAH box helicase [Isosphaeraceae bacterium]